MYPNIDNKVIKWIIYFSSYYSIFKLFIESTNHSSSYTEFSLYFLWWRFFGFLLGLNPNYDNPLNTDNWDSD